MDFSFLLPIVCVLCSITLLFLGFFYKLLAKLPKSPTLDVQPLMEEGFAEFFEQVQPDFKQALQDPEVEQYLAGVVMGAIAHLFSEEENQKLFGDFLKAQMAELVPEIPNFAPKSPEEQEKITENVQKITKELAMGYIDENLPPFAAGILDKQVPGWRELMGDSPETLAGVAGFLQQIGLKQKGEEALQNLLGNLTRSTSNPAGRRSGGGVRG